MADPVGRITFYADDDVDGRAIRWAQRLGVPIVTSDEAGLRGARDRDHFAYAVEHGYVLVTGNIQDYEALYYEYAAQNLDHPGMVFINPKVRRSYGAIAEWLEVIHDQMTLEEMRNRIWRT